MLLVLDTSVLLAGLLSSRGASHWVLRRVLEGKVHIAASVPLFIEYEDVLRRPLHLRRVGWSEADVEVFLNGLATLVEQTPISFLWRPGAVDPSDEMVVECAVSSGAAAVITFNVRHFRTASKDFGFDVLTPVEAVRSLRRGGIGP